MKLRIKVIDMPNWYHCFISDVSTCLTIAFSGTERPSFAFNPTEKPRADGRTNWWEGLVRGMKMKEGKTDHGIMFLVSRLIVFWDCNMVCFWVVFCVSATLKPCCHHLHHAPFFCTTPTTLNFHVHFVCSFLLEAIRKFMSLLSGFGICPIPRTPPSTKVYRGSQSTCWWSIERKMTMDLSLPNQLLFPIISP